MTETTTQILCGDSREVLSTLPAASVHCCVTSPPYFGLRDYGCDGQIGLEKTPDAYVAELVGVFREVRRVLRDDGTLWLNLGDSYAAGGMSNPSEKSTLCGGKDRGAAGYAIQRKPQPGTKPKDLLGIPWRVAFALQSDGWYLRQDIIWHKPNPMPESVRDRCTKAHEYLFLLSKSPRYYFDAEAISEPLAGPPHAPGNKATKEGGHNRKDFGTDRMERVWGASGRRNRRDVWTVATKPYKGAHFACFPPKLVEPCILAGSPVGGTVLDPFFGAGTTGMVAAEHGRNCIGVELNPDYVALSENRLGLIAS